VPRFFGEARGPERARVRLHVGLGHDGGGREQEQRAETREDEEDGSPAEQRVEESADHRGEDGVQRLRGAHEREHAGRPIARIDVAHDRARDDLPAARAEGLQHARGHERADAGRERTDEPRRRVEPKAGDERAATAEAIGERAPRELRRGEAREEQRHRELGGGGIRAVGPRQGGQRR
jgi:hypothetical protein